MIQPVRPTLLSRRSRLWGVVALLLLAGVGRPAMADADTDQLNGSWVLDAERSESYQGAAKVVKMQILKLHKRHKKDSFGGSRSSTGNNKYYEQENYSKELRAEDTVDIDWELPGPLAAVMEGKSLKIYQARMCAVLYDKKFKRLFAINPEGNSYSAKGSELAHDDIGRTFGYFEGKTLVIDTDVKGGDRLLEKLSVNAGGDELTVETRYRRTDLARTLTYTRIFRRGE